MKTNCIGDLKFPLNIPSKNCFPILLARKKRPIEEGKVIVKWGPRSDSNQFDSITRTCRTGFGKPGFSRSIVFRLNAAVVPLLLPVGRGYEASLVLLFESHVFVPCRTTMATALVLVQNDRESVPTMVRLTRPIRFPCKFNVNNHIANMPDGRRLDFWNFSLTVGWNSFRKLDRNFIRAYQDRRKSFGNS